MFQLKHILVKACLTKNSKIFTEVLNSKAILKMPRTRTGLVKKTYSENLETKPGYQTTITIEIFIEATRNEINNEIKKTKRPNYSNLSVKEQKALQELLSRDDIVITEVDKGGAVVIFDVEDYVKEAERQLHNTKKYKRLNPSPTTTNMIQLRR